MWRFNGVALMPTTAKILKGGGHQVTNTAGTDERFAGRAVCREGGLRSWKRWAPWETHWGKRASFTIFRSTSSSSHRYEQLERHRCGSVSSRQKPEERSETDAGVLVDRTGEEIARGCGRTPEDGNPTYVEIRSTHRPKTVEAVSRRTFSRDIAARRIAAPPSPSSASSS